MRLKNEQRHENLQRQLTLFARKQVASRSDRADQLSQRRINDLLIGLWWYENIHTIGTVTLVHLF